MPVMTSWSKTQEPPNPLTVGILQILCVHISYYIFNPELLEFIIEWKWYLQVLILHIESQKYQFSLKKTRERLTGKIGNLLGRQSIFLKKKKKKLEDFIERLKRSNNKFCEHL